MAGRLLEQFLDHGLDSYEDVKANKGMIRKVVDKGTMPPWKDKLNEEQIKAMTAFIRKFPE